MVTSRAAARQDWPISIRPKRFRSTLPRRLPNRSQRLLLSQRCVNKCGHAQDGRKLRRYRRRWKIERTIAWISSFRRLIVRHEYYSLSIKDLST